ncbi:MAG: hypothetical protein AB1397_01530, partial [bacterium]
MIISDFGFRIADLLGIWNLFTLCLCAFVLLCLNRTAKRILILFILAFNIGFSQEAKKEDILFQEGLY